MHHRAGVKKNSRANPRKAQRKERRAERRIDRGPRPSHHNSNIYELPDRATRPSFADRGYLYDEQNTAGELERAPGSEGYGRQKKTNDRPKDNGDEQIERTWMPASDPWRPSNETNMAGGFPTPAWRENHVGKGPKGFVRSDERIREQVCEALADHPKIDASDIEVDVSDGEVTLKGTVANRSIKRLAEDVLHELNFVKDVHNHLRSADRNKKSGPH